MTKPPTVNSVTNALTKIVNNGGKTTQKNLLKVTKDWKNVKNKQKKGK